jgi:hypothetical protein
MRQQVDSLQERRNVWAYKLGQHDRKEERDMRDLEYVSAQEWQAYKSGYKGVWRT